MKRNSIETILTELHYFPNIEFFSQAIRCTQVIIEQWEHYNKGSYRNKCFVASSSGVQRLSIPLEKGKHDGQPIKEVKIAYQEPWQRTHWRTLVASYKSAPYFEHYASIVQPFFTKPYIYLFDLNLEILETLRPHLGLPPVFRLSDAYHKTYDSSVMDIRHKISSKKWPIVSSSGFHPSKYSQVFEEKTGFLPNLSILDLLFCTGPEAKIILKESFK